MRKNKRDIRLFKGEMTVEMTFIVPVIFLVFMLLIYAVFYFHDKVILNGAAAEVIAAGAQYEREYGKEDIDLQKFYRERTEHKLIFLRLGTVDISKSDKLIEIFVKAGNGPVSASVETRGEIPYPEKEVRKKRKIQEAGREVGIE